MGLSSFHATLLRLSVPVVGELRVMVMLSSPSEYVAWNVHEFVPERVIVKSL